MDWDFVFKFANTAALAGWACLIALPRWRAMVLALQFGLIGALSLLYAAIALTWFFQVEGGGFGTLAAVRKLFEATPMLVAGWVHYLAFDLFVGLWIAREADSAGVSRLFQAPILVATFLFGPLGLLLFYGCRAALLDRPLLSRGTLA